MRVSHMHMCYVSLPPRTRQLVQHAAFKNIKSEEKAVLFFTQLKEKKICMLDISPQLK